MNRWVSESRTRKRESFVVTIPDPLFSITFIGDLGGGGRRIGLVHTLHYSKAKGEQP